VKAHLDPNQRNLDGSSGQDIAVMREMSYPIVQISAYLASFGMIFLLLDSRVGCMISFGHSVYCAIVFNFYHLLPLWKKINRIDYKQNPDVAFTKEFFAKQTTWECGLNYFGAQMVLSILLFAVMMYQRCCMPPA